MNSEAVARWRAAASARLRVAQRLDPRTEFEAALPLWREGFVALVCAAVAAFDAEASQPSDASAAWIALEGIWSNLAKTPLSDHEAARTVLCEARALDAKPRAWADASAACSAVEQLVAVIDRATAGSTPRKPLWRRVLPIAAALVIPAIALVMMLPPHLESGSLTLGKPVKVSSNQESEAPPGGADVVNGRIEHTYGVQTTVEDDPWVLIDLEQSAPVRRIVVYNRGDGWFMDCVPLVVEVGTTEKSLHAIATRETLFTQRRPWTIPVAEDVRFIRVTKRGHGYITLAEIAAYLK